MAADTSKHDFLNRAQELADIIKEHLSACSSFMVISHHDADGLSSGAIIGSTLARAEAKFTVRIVEELREDIISEIAKNQSDVLVFSDIGSGYLDQLTNHHLAKQILIMDHHPPSGTIPKNVIQLNPHEFGIDGARMISASGVCYLVSRQLTSTNRDLSALAIVGALGDMQDKNEKRSLQGLNDLLVEDGISVGSVRVDSDLVLYGRETRPIHRALAYTTTPYLPNLSGREDNCLTLLSSNGISVKEGEKFRTLADLSQEEKQKLLNAIIGYLTSIGFQSNIVLDLVGTVYTLREEAPGSPTHDGREYSALLNACGRTGNSSVGVAVGMGDRERALQEANEIVANYRKTLANYMEWLTNTPTAVQKFSSIWVIRGENQIQPSMTGAFSSVISAGNLFPDHAIVVVTRAEEGGLKLSARAPPKLLGMGVNLGAALNATSKKYSGFGGGHDVAAGAHVRVEDPNPFLKELDQAIISQMKTHAGS